MFSPALVILLCVLQDTPVVPTLTLAPPAAVAPSGSRVKLGAYFRNGGSGPLGLMPPLQLDAELVTPQSRSVVTLSRAGEWPKVQELAPGESLYVEYELELPRDVSGRAVLQLTRLPAAPSIIDVAQPTPGEGSTAPGASSSVPADPVSVAPVRGGFRFADAALQRFRPYEPTYFVGGTDRPNARFQFSFRYQIFNPEGPWASSVPLLAGFFLGYTQTGLWDLEGRSKPFTDTNYKPEIAWSKEDLEWLRIPGVAQTGLQFGIQHESNGRDGPESRSLNVVYVRPVLYFGDARKLAFQAAPKLYAYLPELESNPDIADYRGHCDLRLSAAWADGLQLSALGRLGSGGHHGSMQFDLTYPLRTVGDGNFDMFLWLQWFSGYGESLITYDEYTDALRIGFGFVR